MSAAAGCRRIRAAAVTGAAGFVGAELTRFLLASGVRVRALLHQAASPVSNANLESIRCDITDPASLRGAFDGVDTVFHSAALVGGITLGLPSLRCVNVEGTRNAVRAARQAGSVERFVHVSSVAVMGVSDRSKPIEESDPPAPANPYGISKLEAEFVIAAEAHPLEFVIARPMWVYGEGSPSTRKLLYNISRGRMILIGGGGNLIQPIHVGDLVRGLIRCAEAPAACGQTFNFAGPEPFATRELCAQAARALAVSPPRINLPFWLARAGAALLQAVFSGSGRKIPLDNDKIDFFRLHHCYSIKKAARLLDWQPLIGFQDGINSCRRSM